MSTELAPLADPPDELLDAVARALLEHDRTGPVWGSNPAMSFDSERRRAQYRDKAAVALRAMVDWHNTRAR